MYKIKIFSSFCSTDKAKEAVEEVCVFPNRDDINVSFVGSSCQDYTHVIIWNTATPKIPERIPKENVIGFALEPPLFLGLTPFFIEYAKKNIGKYYIGSSENLPAPFISGNAYLPYSIPQTPSCFQNKKCLMSMIVSGKTMAPGHSYRHQLMENLLSRNFPIDFYGNGMNVGKYKSYHSENIKGKFDKYEPYNDYLFHICIENYQTDDYFSEKIINPLLTESIPLYWGCKKIDRYFPYSIIPLSGTIKKDLTTIYQVLQNPNRFYRPTNFKEIEQKVSLAKNIPDIFS